MKKVETAIKGAPRGIKAPGRAFSCAAVLAFALLAFSAPAAAEVPVKFTYQGNLRQAGFLVNGNRSMVFRIYDSSSAAAELWTSPAYNVSLSTGVFRVTLEPTLPDWESGSLWLELEIEGNRMSPREEITSAPYAVNSLMLSGKRYTTAASAPAAAATGDLWYDTVAGAIKFWNGSVWLLTSGGALPGAHAFTHAAGGSDAIVSLGSHTVTGYIDFDSVGELRVSGSVPAVTIATNAVITGTLNPSSDLLVGGAGYTVTFASSVAAGSFRGDGSGLTNLNASNITSGALTGDRIAPGVLVSTHIADKSLNRIKLAKSGCGHGQILKWDNFNDQWLCADDNFSGAGGESDPLSIHVSTELQNGATFYVSSGTVNYLTVNEWLDSYGPVLIRPAGSGDYERALDVFTPAVADGMNAGTIQFGKQDQANETGYLSFVGAGVAGDEYISIGIKNAENIMSIKGNRNVGIGTSDPWEPLDISRAGGGAGVRFYSNASDQYKAGIPLGESVFRLANTNSLAKGQYSAGGLNIDTSNNIGLGATPIGAKLALTGSTANAYTLVAGTGTAPYHLVLSTSGQLGLGVAAPEATLDLAAAGLGAADMAQIWRDGAGVVVGSMSATGVMMASRFIGDGSGLVNVTAPGDNLGNHIATNTLNMNGYSIAAVSSMTITGAGVAGSDALLEVAGSTLVVRNNGNVGIGEANPAARLAVTGGGASGEYIAVFNSGSKVAAWLRNK